jgi:DNA-binding transcriptional LysR family regulator
MNPTLPLDLLRSFVAVTETGVTCAADRVHRTQPAISLQMKRLEQLVGRPLFLREARRLVLTPAGETLLHHARRMLDINDQALAAIDAHGVSGHVRFGVVQDFADTLLSGVLARFARLYPEASLEVRVSHSGDLNDALAEGRLDLALTFDSTAAGDALLTQSMRWLGGTGLADRDPLPLVLLSPPCVDREAAIAALDRAGRNWRLAVSTPSLAGLRAALSAELGITCRVAVPALASVPEIPVEAALPPLPEVAFRLRQRPHLNAAAVMLADLIADSLV